MKSEFERSRDEFVNQKIDEGAKGITYGKTYFNGLSDGADWAFEVIKLWRQNVKDEHKK